MLNREVLYRTPDRPEAAPYLAISNALDQRGVAQIALDPGGRRNPKEFVNAGHLNDRGAQRYSALLGQALRQQRALPDTSSSTGPAR